MKNPQMIARSNMERLVSQQGGAKEDIYLAKGSGLVVGTYKWLTPNGEIASFPWSEATAREARKERRKLGDWRDEEPSGKMLLAILAALSFVTGAAIWALSRAL